MTAATSAIQKSRLRLKTTAAVGMTIADATRPTNARPLASQPPPPQYVSVPDEPLLSQSKPSQRQRTHPPTMRNTTIASHAARMPGDNQAEADATNLNLA